MSVACIIAALSITRPTAAQYDSSTQLSGSTNDPVGVVVGGNVSHDSNLFRQPSSVVRTSDTISVAYVGLRIDKQYSLQRFQLDITETILRHEKTTHLDFESLDYRGAWLWQLGTRVTGTLSADRKESLVPFEDVLNPGNNSRNVRVNENRAFTLDAWAFGDWHVLLGVNQTSQRSDQAPAIDPDFKGVGHEAGLKYAVSSGSSISVLRRSTSGDYVNQSSNSDLGSGYQQDESVLKVHWTASEKSTLSGQLAWLDRTQNGAAQRNFSGLAGDLLYSWTPTGKLRMNVIAKRELVPFQDPSGSYIIENTLSVAPTWSITAKTVAHLRVAHTTSNFAGAATGPVIGPPRKDKLNLIDMGVSWSPTDRLNFGIYLLHQVRDSNVPAYAFKDTIARITGSYRF
jgi:exopolysaccharide biosynthesis operon protein EpsL